MPLCSFGVYCDKGNWISEKKKMKNDGKTTKGRFKKGNKAGKKFSATNQPDPSKKGPKGRRVTTILKDLLDTKIKNPNDPSGGELPANEAIAVKIITLCMDGNIQAIKELLDRTEGKVATPIEVDDHRKERTLESVEAEIAQLEKELDEPDK